MKEEKNRSSFSDSLPWILFLTAALYLFLSSFATAGVYGLIRLLERLWDTSPAVTFINMNYTVTAGSVIVLAIVCSVVRKNRFILRSFLPRGAGKNHKIKVAEDTYRPSQENTPGKLLLGMFIGFLTNSACILCAMIHGDLRFSLHFSFSMIPVLIYALLMVFVQSSSEELWCRGFMYERICIRYPLLAAAAVNGLFFGGLHLFNENVSVLAMADLIISGISYSLVRWYTGSIWTVMGIHTMWNFTQNFLFGLPNSGLVSQVSLLRLDASAGTSSLVYDCGFGVEGALPAVIADCLLGVSVLILAKKKGRLGELKMSYAGREKEMMGKR